MSSHTGSSTLLAVHAAVAPLLGDARIAAPLTSQLLAGEVLTVLEVRGEWMRVCGPDGYEGWTHRGYLVEARGDETAWPVSLGCQVHAPDQVLRRLPLGARVDPRAAIVEGEIVTMAERAQRFPPQLPAVVHTARTRFAGASYLWAGITPWGVDCSGLVQRAFGLHGVLLPRDAWQQAEATVRVADRISDDLGAGDLLFFSDREDRRITHVGIATGDMQMVHSALMRGGVREERLDDTGDAYVRQLHTQCVGAHRVQLSL